MTINHVSSTNSILTKDYQMAAEIVSKAFQPNKFNQYVTLNCSIEENKKGFADRIKQLIETVDAHVAIDDEVSPSAVAVWIPPEFETPEYEGELHPRFFFAESEITRCCKKYIKGNPYWHLTMLAKDPDQPLVKGAISKVVKPFLENAKKRGIPAVLEAIDERAREIYLHYGFKVYEIFKVGAGELNEAGEYEKGGSGLNVYYMIYNLE